MNVPQFFFQDGRLFFRPAGATSGTPEFKELTPADFDRFDAWIAGYRLALGRPDAPGSLLAIGREMYRWLDGNVRRMERTIMASSPVPLVAEFRVGERPSPEELAFLETPWELLADEHGHLAADARVRFSPVRRIGAPSREEGPSLYRLSAVFMAAEVRNGGGRLQYEREEASVMEATGHVGMDLVVEESGSLALLAERVSRERPVDVLHISCHGTRDGDGARPFLCLEDESGDLAKASPEALHQALERNFPRLLFLSACMSSEPDRLLHSFSSDTVLLGAPAVLGWGGPVGDAEATKFAARLYESLAKKTDLETAVAFARHALIAPDPDRPDAPPSRDWHLARLYLGRRGGGPLCGGERARRRGSRHRGHKEFLDAKAEVPVAGRDEFVGRRRQLQAVLRAFREGTDAFAGVLVHGFGRQGKSSLAARVAHRMPDHKTAVVYGKYDAASVLKAFDEAVPVPAVQQIVREYMGSVVDDPMALKGALRLLLEGPCADLGADRDAGGFLQKLRRLFPWSKGPSQGPARPVLLVLDDLEKILEDPDGNGSHKVNARHVDVLRAAIQAFAGARTLSRLLITSRYRFELDSESGKPLGRRLFSLSLPKMDGHEGEKQAQAKVRAMGKDAEEKALARSLLVKRCVASARGNPGLQDLLFNMALESPAECERALEDMEAYARSGKAPDEESLHEFLKDLAVDRLLGMLSCSERDLLRASTMFLTPVPPEVFSSRGLGDGERLAALGLWELYEDLVVPGRTAAAVNAIARPKAGSLSEEEERELSKLLLPELFEAWGGQDGSRRPAAADLELARVAVFAKDVGVLLSAATNAMLLLEERFEYREAAKMAVEAVAILDDADAGTPSGLLRIASERCSQIGDIDNAKSFAERAVSVLENMGEDDPGFDETKYANALVIRSRLLVNLGQPDEAASSLKKAALMFEKSGDSRSRAVTLGDIARIRVSKGEIDEALALHMERLQVFERLGDSRSRAVTLGDIARIRVSKGEIDEALALHMEMLQVFERLGDSRSRAVTLGDIARIRVSKGEIDEALALHMEMLQVFERLGDSRSRAVTLGDIARIRVSKGEIDEALALHMERLQVFERLGDSRERAVTLGDIARIRVSKGEIDEALALHMEMLQVFERLGDSRSRAVTLGDIARIRVSKGEIDEALALHYEVSNSRFTSVWATVAPGP